MRKGKTLMEVFAKEVPMDPPGENEVVYASDSLEEDYRVRELLDSLGITYRMHPTETYTLIVRRGGLNR